MLTLTLLCMAITFLVVETVCLTLRALGVRRLFFKTVDDAAGHCGFNESTSGAKQHNALSSSNTGLNQLDGEPTDNQMCRSRSSFCQEWSNAPVSLSGLPLSPKGEGPNLSILVVILTIDFCLFSPDCILYMFLAQVDKNADSRLMIRNYFLRKHATVTLTDSADVAIELLCTANYNIVIVDVDVLVTHHSSILID